MLKDCYSIQGTTNVKTTPLPSTPISVTNASKTDMTTQVLPKEALGGSSSSSLLLGYMRLGRATYKLKSPALEFDYDPNFFILSPVEAGESVTRPLLRSLISFWSKEDYLAINNSADELGDFPDKLTVATYGNPDGIPVLDWISGTPSDSLGVEIAGLQQANTTVAGRDTWTFSYRSLFKYEGIIFQAADGQMIVVTAYKPPVDAAAEPYATALSTIVDSMALVVPASE